MKLDLKEVIMTFKMNKKTILIIQKFLILIKIKRKFLYKNSNQEGERIQGMKLCSRVKDKLFLKRN